MPQKGVLLFPGSSTRNGCRCGSIQVLGLEPVANRPIAQHVLEAMAGAGVDEVIIAGPTDVLIDVQSCLSRLGPMTTHLEYAMSGDGSSLMEMLQAAAPLVGAAPCIVHVGDGLLDEPLTAHVGALQESSLDLVLLCPAPSNGSVPGQAPRKRRVTRIVCGEAGVAMFGPGALREACAAHPAADSRGLEEVAREMFERGCHVEVRRADGWRRYQGSPRDLLEVNRLALDRLSPSPDLVAWDENRIEGRVHIHPTATVTTSVIVGPVVVGEGAQVADAYIGPYTSIGARARVEGVEIERSIISPGASVMHIGGRLVSSLVGRGAHVFRDFSLPRAMRLCVGEGDEVALC
jgi:glucose-1-phosphate thymidylyltransferase